MDTWQTFTVLWSCANELSSMPTLSSCPLETMNRWLLRFSTFRLGKYPQDFVDMQAHVFSSVLGGCAAFLTNYHTNSDARVTFRNRKYDLPPWSISILPDCVNEVFNTAKVSWPGTTPATVLGPINIMDVKGPCNSYHILGLCRLDRGQVCFGICLWTRAWSPGKPSMRTYHLSKKIQQYQQPVCWSN